MGKAPAYQMYAQDFDMDTASWPNVAIGIYQRLLNYEWINQGLPQDLQELSSIAREKIKIFERNWIKFVSKKFHENGNGFLVNNRMETVRQTQIKYSESRRKNVSIRYKDKDTHEPTYEKDMDLHTPCSSSSSSSSSLNNKEKDILSGKPDPIPFSSILNYLNLKTGKNFSSKAKTHQGHIRARWNEGKREDDFRKVIDTKFEKWGTDEKMVEYLRPETLFGTKMDSYLNEGSPNAAPLDPMDKRMWEIEQLRRKDEHT